MTAEEFWAAGPAGSIALTQEMVSKAWEEMANAPLLPDIIIVHPSQTRMIRTATVAYKMLNNEKIWKAFLFGFQVRHKALASEKRARKIFDRWCWDQAVIEIEAEDAAEK